MQLIVGLFTEGSTDVRFLSSIIERTLNAIRMECHKDFEILQVYPLKIDKGGKSFVEQVLEASKKGVEDYGIALLCVHTDADDSDTKGAYEYKIIPAQEALQEQDDDYCKIMIAVVPAHELEAWMLADKNLLKITLGTTQTDKQLQLEGNPESIAKPKEMIENMIRLATKSETKRKRKKQNISCLYESMGEQLDLEKLEKLQSFCDFQESIREALRKLKFLY